jgi:hypothetical protein
MASYTHPNSSVHTSRSTGKLMRNLRIYRILEATVVADQAEFRAKNRGKELIVDDGLRDGSHDLARFLIESVGIPARIDTLKLSDDSETNKLIQTH